MAVEPKPSATTDRSTLSDPWKLPSVVNGFAVNRLPDQQQPQSWRSLDRHD
ncbi:hypothetical protein N9M41_04050 [Rhodopirellula sp.]|nr:hypothetical protein [Rhodopirellula sp.]